MTALPKALMPPQTAQRLLPRPGLWLWLFALAFPPLALGDFSLRFLAEILIIGTAVMSLDILVGFGGLVSLGHAALFGGAAYAAALVAFHFGSDLFVILAVGITAGALVAALVGMLVVRTVSLFFLILTLVTGQIVWEVVFHWREVTGGADGFRGLPALKLHLGIASFTLAGARDLYILAAAVAAASYALARSFVDAPIGRALVGSREQPLRMSALGYRIPKIRFLALLASGAIAGAAGALYPFVNQYIGPNAVHWTTSAMMIIMLVIGGVGSLYGAFIGAAVYLGIQTYLSSYTDRWQLLVGLIFVLTVLLVPNGIASGLKSLLARPVPREGRADG